MLKPQALANSFASVAAILYVIFYLLKIIAPPFFRLLLKSQFFGADIASQVPKLSFVNFLGILIAVCVLTWIPGYLVAIIYNHLIEKK